MAETLNAIKSGDRAIAGGVIQWGVTPGASGGSPSNCVQTRDTNDMFSFQSTYSMASGITRGYLFQHGYPGATIFQTILPPNSPSCGGGLYASGNGYYSASSSHSGGVNVLRADASVTFVADTVNCGNQNWTGSEPTGVSPFGVWGGMGSINGHETVSFE